MKYNQSTKKSQGDDYNEMNEQPILLAQPGKRQCPVNSMKLYLSKLTHIEDFFQTPNQYFKFPNDKWFKATPVGENTIGKFMKDISEFSGLTTVYTNHCVRGTTATAMHRSGYSLHDIAQVTRHKNIESLKYYLEKPTIENMKNYSNSLFKYASNDKGKENQNMNNNSNNSDDEDFEEPPVKTRNVYNEVQLAKKTEEKKEVALVCSDQNKQEI